MRAGIQFILASLALTLLAGAAPATTPAANTTVEKPAPAKAVAPLRVAIDPDAPPFVYKSGEKLSGLEIEFAHGLGAALGRPLVFVETPTSNLIDALLADKADIIMSGYSVDRLRLVRVSFCHPYLRIGEMALCRRAELSIFANNANLQNVRVNMGVAAGTTGDMLAASQFSFAGRQTFPSYADAVKALLDKKVDLILADYPVAVWLSAENEATVAVVPGLLSQEDLAWAVRKDDDALRGAANAYLDDLHKSGKLAEMIAKWVPDASPQSIAPSSPPGSAPAASTGTGAAKTPAVNN